jgi:hypothetical protein
MAVATLVVDAAPERSCQDVITATELARGAGGQAIGMLPAALATSGTTPYFTKQSRLSNDRRGVGGGVR